MTAGDLEDIAAMVQERLQAALALGGAEEDAPERIGTGQDAHGYVQVRVDGRGMLKQIDFDRAMADLDEEELREATLAAFQAAQSDLAAPAADASPEAALHDNGVAEAFFALLDKANTDRRNP